MSVLADLNAKTLELRKTRDPLAGSFQAVQASATANAKDRMLAQLNKDNAKATGDRAVLDTSAIKATDDDALKAIQKGIKQVQDMLEKRPDHEASQRELQLLTALLPQMASEDEIRGEVESFVNTATDLPEGGKAVGKVMAHLGSVFGAAMDKAKASVIVREVLAA